MKKAGTVVAVHTHGYLLNNKKNIAFSGKV